MKINIKYSKKKILLLFIKYKIRDFILLFKVIYDFRKRSKDIIELKYFKIFFKIKFNN